MLQTEQIETITSRDGRRPHAVDPRPAGLRKGLHRLLRRSEGSGAEMLRGLPSWQARVEAVHTIPRELDAFNRYAFDHEKFRNLQVPTAFLVGGESASVGRGALEKQAAALPNARVIVLAGQQHRHEHGAGAICPGRHDVSRSIEKEGMR